MGKAARVTVEEKLVLWWCYKQADKETKKEDRSRRDAKRKK